MKLASTLLFLLVVTARCSREDSQTGNHQRTESAELISRHREIEDVIRDYYRSVEEDAKGDLGVSEAEIIDHVQSLIENGFVKEPLILIVSPEGPKWEIVDYATYKSLMTDHAITSRRIHGIQPMIDSLVIDSIRSTLLKALKGDSVE